VEAQGDETQRDDAQDYVSEGLGEEKHECAAKSLDLSRVMVEPSLDCEPADDDKDDTSGKHPETA
jgi:hypothetical protein